MEAGARGDEGEMTGVAPGDGGGPERGSTAAAGPSSERQVIRWERFLPRRSLRVLLVEHDDSTRHIVAALLRKCSYHVAAVADGLKAWAVLKLKCYKFDLVLTEVEMPSLSGIGLLSKIMAAEECKNIPVIMMSSQDSIGVVLKCMLKGAVDFLVKPVRKNELRNLWQHVWRRHCSNNATNASDNNAASNHVSVNAGDGSKTGENSDEDDAQSSGSKPEAQSKSVQKHIEILQSVEENRESEPKAEQLNDGTIIVANQLKNYKGHEARDKTSGPTVQVNHSVQSTILAEQREDKNFWCNRSICKEQKQECVRLQKDEDFDPKPYHQPDATNESFQNMIEFIEPTTSRRCVPASMERAASMEDIPCEASTCSHGKCISDFGSSQLLELSLRRPQLDGCVNLEFKEKHVLNHSNASAFSRYSDKKMQHSSQTPVLTSLCIGTKESVEETQQRANLYNSSFSETCHALSSKEMLTSDRSKAIEAAIYFQISSDSNKEDGGILSSHPIHDDASHPQYNFLSLPVPVGAIPYQRLSTRFGATVQPLFLHPNNSTSSEKRMVQDSSVQYIHHESQIMNNTQQLEYHGHEDYHQFSYSRHHAETELGGPGDSSCIPSEQAIQSASSSLDIYNDCGTNDCDKTTEAPASTFNAIESGNESGVQNSGRKGLDCHLSPREAALIKFRLKRKDRCFEKKVRYQSRQKLAEQRPRVKGQFVRQKVIDSTTAAEAED
ncbi:two-component response regulator-like APRR3 isoform X1 [Musa acuminata AAA Group]|uniref:two-component response regulator-like APRR3 isoform X1 n=1 Tax=Musa acuminata AAA Group TaxID=214697 RepID=UPI0031DA8A5C